MDGPTSQLPGLLHAARQYADALGLLLAPFVIAFHRVRFPSPDVKQTKASERYMREHQLVRCTIRLHMRCPELFTCHQGLPHPRATMKT